MENKITYLGTITIAGFMGYKFYDTDKESYPFGYWQQEINQEREEDNFKIADDEMIFDLNYHTDWRKLMAVIEKIEELDFDKNLGYSITIVQFVCLIKRNSFQKDKQELIIDSPANSKIQATWNGIVNFIEWHNKQTAVTPKGID